jgi:predicted nucleic acid-binding protein
MAEALILDCEALNVLARPSDRGANADRARAVLATAHERRALVRVPAPVLAEVYRGPRFNPAIDRLLNGKGLLVVPLTHEIARVAGHLLSSAKLGSAHAIDAFVVATALSFDAALIATGDPTDIKRLVGSQTQVRVFSI